MAQRKKRRKLPLSGNNLPDWIFRQIIKTLDKVERVKVFSVADLKDPDDNRKKLCGFSDHDRHDNLLLKSGFVFLTKNKKKYRDNDTLCGIFVHEIMHILMPDANEKEIRRLEDILCTSFTDKQKRFLKNYIPKHLSKKQPRDLY